MQLKRAAGASRDENCLDGQSSRERKLEEALRQCQAGFELLIAFIGQDSSSLVPAQAQKFIDFIDDTLTKQTPPGGFF